MGMSVSLLGSEAHDPQLREDLRTLSSALQPETFELATVTPPSPYEQFTEAMGSYSNIFRLQLLACQLSSGTVPQEPVTNREQVHTLISTLRAKCKYRHLLEPWNAKRTYYLPLAFSEPILNVPAVTGWKRWFSKDSCSAGSSAQLLTELNEINSFLRMKGDAGDTSVDQVLDETDNDPWGSEKYVWAILRWFARESIRQRGVVAFA